jgi:LysR family glycine cleavage system transcriptional activator
LRLRKRKRSTAAPSRPEDLYTAHDPPGDMPPLHSLRVFTVAARCGSFSAAARELSVTQSAVSRQIQQLEAHLGVKLFARRKLGLRLTPDAEALVPAIEDAFARVSRACERVRTTGQVLTLRLPPTFAIRWLLPRLSTLRETMPGVDVRLITSESRQPLAASDDVDAAIIYGHGNWQDVACIHLMAERLTPVCSPELAKNLCAPADLQRAQLLQCDPIQAWDRWLEVAGVRWTPVYHQTFDVLEFALLAAAHGQGVALGDLSLLKQTRREGVLVAPFDCIVDRGIGYYLIYPPERGVLPKIRALREWLAEAMKGST